jgi:Uma2 family endonuclease
MNWQEVCDDPILRELPYKIELNEWGQIVMSPASNRHGMLQALLVEALRQATRDGMVITECSIQTAKGVKVPDVVWASSEFLKAFGETTPYPKSPELCVEVLSPSNSPLEMEEKRELYFARGAQEVWLCDEQGALAFYDCTGPIPASRLFSGVSRVESDYLH